MPRQVRLAFGGAAAIPVTNYERTEDRVPGVDAVPGTPAIPGLPGHPGYPAGVATEWNIEPHARTGFSNQNPLNAGIIEPGKMSFYLLDNIISGSRWYGQDTEEWRNWYRGFGYIGISVKDRFNVDRREELLAIEGGQEIIIPHLEAAPNGLILRWKALISAVGPALQEYEGTDENKDDYVYYICSSILEGYNSQGEWEEIALELDGLFEGKRVFRVRSSEVPEYGINPSTWKPSKWGIEGIGAGVVTEGTLGTPEQEDWRHRYYDTHSTSGDALDENEWSSDVHADGSRDPTNEASVVDTRIGSIFYMYLSLEAYDRSAFFGDFELEMYSGLWEINAIARIEQDPDHATQIKLTLLREVRLSGGTSNDRFDPEAIWGDINTRRIIITTPGTPGIPGESIPPSPAIPPFGGTPGTPAVPGIPAIPGIPARYANAAYGRPALPAFAIWAERISMVMTHRIENELEIVDLQISGHDYIIRQDWVAPKDYRVRPFCWLTDERGITQVVESVDQSEDLATRFSTMAFVDGPANAVAVPIPDDFERGDNLEEPQFLVRPEMVNRLRDVHGPIPDPDDQGGDQPNGDQPGNDNGQAPGGGFTAKEIRAMIQAEIAAHTDISHAHHAPRELYLGPYSNLSNNARSTVDIGQYALLNNRFWIVHLRAQARANSPGSGPNDGWRPIDGQYRGTAPPVPRFYDTGDHTIVAGVLYFCEVEGSYTAEQIAASPNWSGPTDAVDQVARAAAQGAMERAAANTAAIAGLSGGSGRTEVLVPFRPGALPDAILIEATGYVIAGNYNRYISPHYVSAEGGYTLSVDDAEDFANEPNIVALLAGGQSDPIGILPDSPTPAGQSRLFRNANNVYTVSARPSAIINLHFVRNVGGSRYFNPDGRVARFPEGGAATPDFNAEHNWIAGLGIIAIGNDKRIELITDGDQPGGTLRVSLGAPGGAAVEHLLVPLVADPNAYHSGLVDDIPDGQDLEFSVTNNNNPRILHDGLHFELFVLEEELEARLVPLQERVAALEGRS